MEGRKGGGDRRELWQRMARSSRGLVAGEEEVEARERGSRPRFYLDFFMNSSSGSCTERTEAGIDQEKEESPQP